MIIAEVVIMYIFDSDIFRAKLKDSNMKQCELAKHTHITESAVSKYLSGERIPNINNLFKICEVLDVPADYFIVRL